MRTKSHEIPERYKITIIAILLTGCLCLTFYTHLILKTGVICTHFFYVPIVLSAIWWKRKGIVVAVCSGVAVILSSAVFLETDLMNNFLRGFVFVVISFVVAMLSERIAKGEKELRKSEKKYRSIFENSVEGIFRTTPEGKFITANQALAQIHGYDSPEEFIETITDIGHQLYADPEDRLVMMKQLEEHGMLKGFETQLCRKDGGRIWGSLNLRTVHDEKGTLLYYEGLLEDITARKQAEEKLRKSEREKSVILDTMSEPVYHIDTNMKILSGNKASRELLNLSPDQAEGKICYEVFHDRNKPCDACPITKVFETGKPHESDVVSSFGKKWVLRACPVHDGSGNVTSAIEVVHDITAIKEAEEEMRQSEEKHRTILENIEEGYFEVDIAGNFTFFSDSLCEILGYSREEMMGMNNRQYMDKENAGKVFKTFNKVYSTGNLIKDFNWEIMRKSGNRRYLETSVSLMKGSDGGPIGFRGIARDITERKLAEQERKMLESRLRQVQKMESIGILAGGIAHDFNNLLMGIQGNTSLALLDMDSTYPGYERLKNIEQYTQNGAELTGQLLGFARGGKYVVKPTDMNELIKKSSSMFGRTRKEIKIYRKYQEDIWTVEVDPLSGLSCTLPLLPITPPSCQRQHVLNNGCGLFSRFLYGRNRFPQRAVFRKLH